jgi:Flp pilus assembly protein TadG
VLVQIDDVAVPVESVVSVSVVVPVEAKVQVATVFGTTGGPALPFSAGAVNITATPTDGFPFTVTVATRGAVNAAPTTVLCPDPLATLSVGVGGIVLVALA